MEEIAQDPLLETGMIQTYEFCIELAWKTMKDFLEHKGLLRKNPKDVFREAFVQGYLTNTEDWMKALEDRNLTSHAYDEAIAKEVVRRIATQYFVLLEDLFLFFQKHYAEETG